MMHGKTPTEELDRMIEEAVVDAYDDYEQFMGVLYHLEANLSFPFKTKALGDTVEVIGVDDEKSGMGQGIIAVVRKTGKEDRIGLAELELEPGDTKNAKWFERYDYWLGNY